MGRFVADPQILKIKGNEMENQAQQFAQNVEKIYSTVEEMINSDYLSPAAKAIADEIKSYREDLNAMTRKISRYGEFCKNASNKVIRNDTNIVNSIK